ncbi:MAG: hypothetical protein MPJ50_18215, partial [Pirellulales bacterium]|nr:hypothetical protein [Pirellulales bacterium]
VRVGMLVLAVLLAIYAAVPGTAQELTPRRLAASLEHSNTLESRIIPATDHFEIRALPYDHAADWGGWLLLATATLPWLVAQWEKRHSINVMGLMLGAAAVCPLLATMFEVDIAVASAWRWLSAGLFLLTAGCIWGRRHIAACGTMLGWPPDGKLLTGASTKRITTALIVLSAAPLAGMLTYISLAALAQSSLDLTVRVVFPVTVASIVMGFIIWSVLRGEQSQSSEERLVWRGVASRLAAIMGAAPLVVVSMYAVTVALRGNPIAGPEPDTLFHVMGRAVSYAVPLLLGALALSGFAVRERSAKFALAAGLFFNASATAGYLLVAAKGGKPLDVELWIRVAQFNAIVSGLFVLAWSYALRWSRQTPPPDNLPGNASDELTAILRRSGMLTTYALFSVALHALPMTFGLVRLFINPTDVAEIAVVAGGWGWSMLLVVALACVSAVRSIGLRVGAAWFSIGCVATVFMAIFQLARFDRGDWLAYHSLLISLTAGSWFILLVDIWQRRRLDLVAVSAPRAGRSVELASSVLAITAIIFALREAVSQTHLWWSAATMIAIAALAAAFGFVRLRRWPAYASTCMMAMATALAWWQFASDGFAFVGRTVLDLANCIVIVQGLACVAWIGLERSITVSKQQSNNEQSSRRTCIVGCHRVIAALALIAVLGQVVLQILSQAAVGWSPLNTAILWMTIISAGVGCVACLWDARCKSTVAKLYIGGLVVAGMALGQYQLSPKMMLWIGTIFLSAYALLTSYLWSRRQGLATFARRLSIPVSDNEFAGQRWLVQFNGLLIAAVLTTATVVVLNYGEQSQRLAVGQAALLQTLSLGMLARGERRSQLQLATLVAAALASVLWGWAWLAPPQAGPLLNHGVVVTIVLTTLTALYGLGLAKFFPRQTEWTSAAGRLVPSLASATIIALAVVLGAEASYFVAGDAIPISLAGIIAVGCCLALLSAAVLVAALVPGRDPFKLSDRGRMNYVYAAEGLLALLFAHIRLTLPWLFHGILTQYWPLLIVTLAFCGVGLAEVFRRQRRDVLAEPLERTGAALPLLPALGFWLAPQGEYSLVLLAVGAVYASLAIMRRSFGFGVLAALAANGALWFHLSGINGLEFWRHPQLWMIPGSLCLLGAAYINRQQLSEGQMTSIRYFSASMIYLASTADVFLNGVAEAPWLPLVLAALSIIGVLGGMLLRVRAFLFLGTSFLLLSLSTIIWYAAVDLHQTWLLWLTVVAIGVAILALFALFEKKREDVLKVLNGLRNWSP